MCSTDNREVCAVLFDVHGYIHLTNMFVKQEMHIADIRVRLFVSAWASIYLLCRIAVNHVRHERDLPVQEGGRSQVQRNLVCHHHCDVHSWRNWLNCPTWESTEIRNTSVTSIHSFKSLKLPCAEWYPLKLLLAIFQTHFLSDQIFSFRPSNLLFGRNCWTFLGNMLMSILAKCLSFLYWPGPRGQLAWLSHNDWERVEAAR